MNHYSGDTTPQFRLAVIGRCDLHCQYCRPEGEGCYAEPTNGLPIGYIDRIVDLAAREGITHIKITGGEPLLRGDVGEIIESVRNTPGICDVQLVTNGILLKKRARMLKDAGIGLLTVSVDSADEAEYRRIRGASLRLVEEGLAECSSIGISIRINSVIMRSNLHQVDGLVQLASRYGASLKLLDLIDLRPCPPSEFWKKEFVDLRILDERFSQVAEGEGYEKAPGGIGAPLRCYVLSNAQEVVIKQSTRGGFYHPSCKNCRLYPCQDALISIRLTHNGLLKKCLVRNDNLVDILNPLMKGNESQATAAFRSMFRTFCQSQFVREEWWNSI